MRIHIFYDCGKNGRPVATFWDNGSIKNAAQYLWPRNKDRQLSAQEELENEGWTNNGPIYAVKKD